jgi:hypothetical protein
MFFDMTFPESLHDFDYFFRGKQTSGKWRLHQGSVSGKIPRIRRRTPRFLKKAVAIANIAPRPAMIPFSIIFIPEKGGFFILFILLEKIGERPQRKFLARARWN